MKYWTSGFLRYNDEKYFINEYALALLLDSLEMKKMIRLKSWQNGQKNEITYVSIILYIYMRSINIVNTLIHFHPFR